MKFTKDQTNIAKGVAICLMLAVHLYPIDSEKYRLLNNNYYIPLIPIFDIEENIGAFGRICISMFLFLSGYGMLIGYKKYGKTALQYSLKKLIDFYKIYWLYFLIFIPIGLLFFRNVPRWNSTQPRYPLDIGIFIQNFIGWSHSYNEEWWFVQLFVLLLIFLCPIYLSLATRNIRLLIFLSSLLFIARIVCKIVWKVEDIYSFPGNLLYWQAPFAVGVIAAEINLFSSQLFRYFDTLKRVWIFAGVLLCYSGSYTSKVRQNSISSGFPALRMYLIEPRIAICPGLFTTRHHFRSSPCCLLYIFCKQGNSYSWRRKDICLFRPLLFSCLAYSFVLLLSLFSRHRIFSKILAVDIRSSLIYVTFNGFSSRTLTSSLR